MMDWNGPSAGGWFVMTVLMLIFWVTVIGIGYALIRRTSAPNQPGDHDLAVPPTRPNDISDALRVLDERLARGELDPDDYQRRRALLTTHRER